MGNSEMLKKLRSVYGQNVMCTNGLFHILDDSHNEIYINVAKNCIDKRGKYRTIVVCDKIVVCEITTSPIFKYLILDKNTLECLFKTSGVIEYVDNNIMICIEEDTIKILSHTGNVLAELEDYISITHLYGGNYLVKSKQMFNDHIIYYDKFRDKIIELTKGKNYTITILDGNPREIEVISMHGGKYNYNFERKSCYNCFTNAEERQTFLWKVF